MHLLNDNIVKDNKLQTIIWTQSDLEWIGLVFSNYV